MANEQAQTSEREIEEDVVNVGFIAWLGGVATILIAVSVILLTAVYYVTLDQREARLQEEADARVTDLEAQQVIDAMVVDGFFKHPDVDDGQGNVSRGTVSIPVSEGMKKVIEDANR